VADEALAASARYRVVGSVVGIMGLPRRKPTPDVDFAERHSLDNGCPCGCCDIVSTRPEYGSMWPCELASFTESPEPTADDARVFRVAFRWFALFVAALVAVAVVIAFAG
jgi:hypothetical protein